MESGSALPGRFTVLSRACGNNAGIKTLEVLHLEKELGALQQSWHATQARLLECLQQAHVYVPVHWCALVGRQRLRLQHKASCSSSGVRVCRGKSTVAMMNRRGTTPPSADRSCHRGNPSTSVFFSNRFLVMIGLLEKLSHVIKQSESE